MKRILLALASVCVAVGVMAQGTATSGLVTMKTKAAGVDAKVTLVDRNGNPYTPATPWAPTTPGGEGWYVELWLANGTSALTGIRNGTGASQIVREEFSASTGYVGGGTRDWALDGVTQGAASAFKLVAYYSPTGAETWSTLQNNPLSVGAFSQAFTITPGGNQLSPPQVPAGLTTAAAWTVAVPEPSILALGVLGMGAFLLRRRS